MRFIVDLHRFHAPYSRALCARALGSRLTSHLQERCQPRGGRKGGLPACEENELAANDAVTFAEAEGKVMIADVPTKLKHFSAQVAMVPQWSMACSHGSAS